MNILLTGGAGYIGSHTAVVLAKAGHDVVLYDSFVNSKPDVDERLAQIIGRRLPFVAGDVRDTDLLQQVLQDHRIDAVIHFAGLKAVAESVQRPIDYYANNVQGAVSLLQAMRAVNIKNLVFSSSATVYGDPKYLPIDEGHPTSATNPYGRSKLHIEEMLADVAKSAPDWQIACLRYFNPIGAHESGLIGEAPIGNPNNLMPYIARVAAGKFPYVNIFGADYATPDGTGVRDYIHVMDLAEGHHAALNFINRVAPYRIDSNKNFHVFNLGTGRGYSVLEMIRSFELASGEQVPYRIVPRREGDIAACYAHIDKSAHELGWRACRTIFDMCASIWRFELQSRIEQAQTLENQ